MFLRKIGAIIFLITLTVLVISFGVYKAYPLFAGPTISIVSPKNGEKISGTTAKLSGNVARVKHMYVNEIPVRFTETGYFDTIVPINKGNNLLKIIVSDKFERIREQTFVLLGE